MAFSMMSMCIATLLRASSWAFPILQPLRTRPGPDGLPRRPTWRGGATVPLLAAGQAGATFPGGNGKIAFASYRDGDRDGLDGDWEVREGVVDDFFRHFFGPRAGVENVVLDPLPGAMGDGAAGPAGIGPGRFVDRFLGAPAPRRGGGLTGGNPLTADRPSA